MSVYFSRAVREWKLQSPEPDGRYQGSTRDTVLHLSSDYSSVMPIQTGVLLSLSLMVRNYDVVSSINCMLHVTSPG